MSHTPFTQFGATQYETHDQSAWTPAPQSTEIHAPQPQQQAQIPHHATPTPISSFNMEYALQAMWDKTREQEDKLDSIMKFLENERGPSQQQGTSSGGQTHVPQAMPIPVPVPTLIQAPAQVQDTIKMEAPDAFDGDRKKLRSFKTSVTIYFNANPKHFGTHSN